MDPESLINNRYRVVRRLGEGGMGTVFLVRDDLDGGRELALKTLAPDRIEPARLEFFRHEFRAMTELVHPNVVRVYDFGLVDGSERCFFTLDHVDGLDFYTATRDLGYEDLYPLIVQVCRGLEYIHARGVVHHDLKPGNIMMVTRPSGGTAEDATVKIMDFGLATRVSARLPATVRGTIHYMAPEVIKGGFVDARVDLYSLGIVLYQVATRRLPFEGNSTVALARAHLEETPEPPTSIREDIPRALESLILRLIAKDPADRYRSANEVILDLNRRLGASFPLETQATREGWIQTGRLVGRDTQLARLKEAFRVHVLESPGPPGTAPQVLLLEGEAGLGKSRLLRELRYHAQIHGAAWCQGEAGGKGGASYGAVEEALRQVVAALPARPGPPSGGPGASPGTLAPLARHGPELVKLLPELARSEGMSPSPSMGPDADRSRLREALALFVVEAARVRPTVLCLEDLHAADPGTADLLGDVARRLALHRPGPPGAPASRLLVCASYRVDEAPAGVLHAAEEAVRLGVGERLALARLSDQEVSELVRSMLPVEDREATLVAKVASETGGNPYFIEELMKSVAETGCLVHRAGQWVLDRGRLATVQVPATVERLLAASVARLSGGARALLAAMAVVDEAADLLLLSVASRLDAGALIAGAAELEHARMALRERAGDLRIAHAQLREAVYRSTPEPERARLHAAVLAEVLDRRASTEATAKDPEVETLARHALRARDPGPAVLYGTLAAERCRDLYFNERALYYARRSLELVGPRHHAARGKLLRLCVSVHKHLGDLPAAEAACREWLSSARDGGDPGQEGQAYLFLGSVRADAADYEAALGHFAQARGLLARAGDERALANLSQQVGLVHSERGSYADALREMEGALARFRGLGDRFGVAACLNNTATILRDTQSQEEGLRRMEEARAILEDLGDRYASSAILTNIGNIWRDQGRMDEALRAYERALEGFEAVGHRQGQGTIYSIIASHHWRLGHGEMANDYLQRSLEIRREIGDRAGEANALNQLGIIAQNRGDHAQGQQIHQQVLALERALGNRKGQTNSLINLGDVFSDRGEHHRAIACYGEALSLCEANGYKLNAAICHFNLASSSLVLGRAGEAAEHLERSRATQHDVPNRELELAGDIMDGALDLARGEAGRALTTLDRAVEGAEDLGDGQTRLAAAHHRSEALLALERWDELAAEVGRLEDLAAALESRPYRVRALLLRGLCHQGRGEAVEARAFLQEAADLAGECEEPESLWRSWHALGKVHHAAGRAREAGLSYGKAIEVLHGVWSHLPPEYREDYLSEPRRAEVHADADRLLGERGATRGPDTSAAPSGPADGARPANPASRASPDSMPRVPADAQPVEDARLARVLDLSRAIAQELAPRRLLRLVLDASVEISGAERGFIILREDMRASTPAADGGPEVWEVRVARNLDREDLSGAEGKVSRHVVERVLETGQPLVTEDAQGSVELARFASVGRMQLRAVACLPLRVGGRAIGAVYLDNRFAPGVFSRRDLTLLASLADQTAIAWDKARLFEENRRRRRELSRAKARVEELARRLSGELDRATTRLDSAEATLAASRSEWNLRHDYARIVGRSRAVQELLRLLDRVAESAAPVLITGESGTGKELVARCLHANGPRREAPFVGENCAAIPEEIFESELFGHVRGAFTGAVEDRPGLFRLAQGGTIFLDEVGELVPACQVKLLRVLEEREVRPVGAAEPVPVDVRVVAATQRDLGAMVDAGAFREDLYYRLNVLPVHLAPLRERREDVPLLLEHFLAEEGNQGVRLGAEAIDRLAAYPWPGNVRELANEVARLVSLGKAEVGPEDLSPAVRGQAPDAPGTAGLGPGLDEAAADYERGLILSALERHGGNVAAAARELRVDRMKLTRKLRKYGLERRGGP
ncbi:MAG: sigma 54-interacting transcriptional regulator [Planctomycetes bacterium]|nr:sigma 54-interacting transcriptional regulator [Planctomycetota bacterium]